MAARKTPQNLRTGGHVWGQRRVELGLSLRQLQDISGVSRGLLSMMETGRMIPKAEEFNAVMKALDQEAERQSASQGAAAI